MRSRGVALEQAPLEQAAREQAEDRPPKGQGRAGAPKGAWLGVLAVSLATLWFAFIGFRALFDAHDVGQALAQGRGVMVAPALFVAVAVIFLAERRWPAVRRPPLARPHLVDAGYLALFAVVIAPLVTLVDTGFAQEVGWHAPFLILSRLPLIPQALVVGLILVGMDAMNWLAHAANHRSAALWRLHALHHSQEDMSVFTTFRTHPLIHTSYLPALVPALILGTSGTVPGSALIAYGCFVALAHANLGWTFGPLRGVVVSPAYHRLHHARTPLDDRGAVNFGFVLVCWDRLARRAVFPAGRVPILTGLAGRPVPVEQGARNYRAGAVVLAQLTQPFAMTTTMKGEL